MPTQQVTARTAAAPDRVRGEDVFLASIAGYVDTLGFVALFGLFTAHVTGNFILIGSGLAGVGQGLAIKWLAFPAFIAGIVGARMLDHRMRLLGHGARARALYALQAMLLAGVMASPIADADAHDSVRPARRRGDGRSERARAADGTLGGRQHGDDRQCHAGGDRRVRLARAARRAVRTGSGARAPAAHGAADRRFCARRWRGGGRVSVRSVLGAAARGAVFPRLSIRSARRAAGATLNAGAACCRACPRHHA
ncbi:DUF1275 domain-containing protein [Burkholderia singularis]|uniref:DUF1275 domain-containing protein n=1 Tax=Burkholderia singularis TaxID=1503053 RepID=A0A238HAH3_9BURK|nr:DUF1275 domain-containing protein [Burkholderia singularis]